MPGQSFTTALLGNLSGRGSGNCAGQGRDAAICHSRWHQSWPKLPDIADWHQDQELSMKLAANFLVPDGADPATSEVTIQARGYPRSGETASLSQLMDKDRAAAPPATEVTKRPDIYDKDSTPFNCWRLRRPPDRRETGRRSPIPRKAIICWPSPWMPGPRPPYDKNLPVFTGLIRRYAKDIPW